MEDIEVTYYSEVIEAIVGEKDLLSGVKCANISIWTW